MESSSHQARTARNRTRRSVSLTRPTSHQPAARDAQGRRTPARQAACNQESGRTIEETSRHHEGHLRDGSRTSSLRAFNRRHGVASSARRSSGDSLQEKNQQAHLTRELRKKQMARIHRSRPSSSHFPALRSQLGQQILRMHGLGQNLELIPLRPRLLQQVRRRRLP